MGVRDALWLWGHPAGSHNGIYGVPGESRITPVEAACYLGVPNLVMVNYGEHGPFPPLDRFALPMRSLDKVVWSIVGASGETNAGGREEVFRLAHRLPNMTGVIMDDFFREKPTTAGSAAVLSPDELRAIRAQLQLPDRALDLWVVLYDYMLANPVAGYLDLCDQVTFWTWRAENLPHLERNYERFEQLTPRQGRLVGCYLWDYGASRPMPLDLMKQQCEFSLGLLRQGRIEGVIFLASCICDLELETVEWLRGWISQVGDQSVPA